MKVNILEAHDRLLHFKKDQEVNVFNGADDCMKRNELSLSIQEKSPYVYLFAHPRTADDGVTKVMYWQPRLSVPEAQPNSYLFRGISKTDIVEVIWLLPPAELWKQYEKGNVLEHQDVLYSINMFKTNKQALEAPHPDDFSEEQCKKIMKSVIQEKIDSLKGNKFIKLDSLEGFPASF